MFLFVFFLLLSACTKIDGLPSAPPPLSPEPSPAEPSVIPLPSVPPPVYPSVDLTADWADNGLTVEQTVFQNTFRSGNTDTLAADGSFPQTGVAAIDLFYTNSRDDFGRLSESLAEEAAGDRLLYQLDAGFAVEISAGGIFSVSRTIYLFTGGAHGMTDIVCETFHLPSGRLLTLDDFFSAGREEYTARLLEYVDYVISRTPDEFWPDARQIARDVFPYDTFVITRDGISLIFPEYNIAPFTAGTVRVDVPWGAVAEMFVLP
jgi:hypothetical protein